MDKEVTVTVEVDGKQVNHGLRSWQWSRKHDCCKECSTNINPHYAKGLCYSCYYRRCSRLFRAKKRKAGYREVHVRRWVKVAD